MLNRFSAVIKCKIQYIDYCRV